MTKDQLRAFVLAQIRKDNPDWTARHVERVTDAAIIAKVLIQTYEELSASCEGTSLVVNPVDLLTETNYRMVRDGWVMLEGFKQFLLHLQSRFGEENIPLPPMLNHTLLFMHNWIVVYDQEKEGKL